MASINKKITLLTGEGGPAKNVSVQEQFLRTLNACLLWEDNFYEDGESVADRLKRLAKESVLIPGNTKWTVNAIYRARQSLGLRHAPLWAAIGLAEVKMLSKELVSSILMRPDDATELLALYWKDGKKPLPKAIQKGLAAFFQTLDEYRLAKYGNREGSVALRDVLFLSHAKPQSKAQEKLWKKFIDKKLEPADTWEVALSAGADKKETFEALLAEEKLGTLALLRNLRNMIEAGVDEKILAAGITSANPERIFPYQILKAAQYAPRFEPELEGLLFKCLAKYEKLAGKTVFLVDHSGSMSEAISSKSEMHRHDAAVALAVMLREVCENVVVYEFNNGATIVPPRHGFALAAAMGSPAGGTELGQSLLGVFANEPDLERLIVITDEQTADRLPALPNIHAYMVNVATEQNGVGYGGPWVHVNGFSQSLVEYILGYEARA